MRKEELKLEPGYTMCDVCLHDMICKAEQRGEPYRDVDMCIMFEPQRSHGEFKLYKDDDYSGGGYILCTACKYRFSFGAYKILENDNYCPHCGAKIIRRPDPDTKTFTFNICMKPEDKPDGKP